MIVMKAPQEQLLSVLQSVAGIVERRHTCLSWPNVLIRKTNDQLQWTTSDLKFKSASAQLACDR